MEEIIKQYLKEHLSLNIKEEAFGFNGKCIILELKIDDEIISSQVIHIL